MFPLSRNDIISSTVPPICGGPVSVWAGALLKDASTLHANTPQLSLKNALKKASAQPFLQNAIPAAKAAPLQYGIIGPGYHLVVKHSGSKHAGVLAATLLSQGITYIPQTKQVQVAGANGRTSMPSQLSWDVNGIRHRLHTCATGPGAIAFGLRNLSTLFGLRYATEPATQFWDKALSGNLKASSPNIEKVAGQYSGNLIGGILSTLPNTYHQIRAVQAVLNTQASLPVNPRTMVYFYITQGLLRIGYNTVVFGTYGSIEKLTQLTLNPKSEGSF